MAPTQPSRPLPSYAQRGGYSSIVDGNGGGSPFRSGFHPPAASSSRGATSPYRYETGAQHASPSAGPGPGPMYIPGPQQPQYMPGPRMPYGHPDQLQAPPPPTLGPSQSHYDHEDAASSEAKSTPSPAVSAVASGKKSNGKRARDVSRDEEPSSSSSRAKRSGSPAQEAAGQGESQKRKKKAVSCEGCRRRKLKCDRGWPCGACRDRDESHLCTWEGGTRPQGTGRDLGNAPLLNRLERIEELLAQLASKVESSSSREGQASVTNSPALPKGKGGPKKGAGAVTASKAIDEAETTLTGSNGRSTAGLAFIISSHKPVSSEAATAEMWDVMKLLPDTETVRRLCRHYFEEIHFMFYVIDEATFWMIGLREHEELRMMNGMQRSRPIPEKDLKRHLLFLSLLLAICSVTLYFNGDEGFREVAAHVGQTQSHGLYLDAAQRAFAASNPFEQPSLLAVRCLILQMWGVSSSRGPNIGQSLLALAIQQSFMLGLDVEPAMSMPKAQRRDRIRLFYSIALLDWLGTGIVKRSYLIREEPRKHPYLFGRKSMKDDINDQNDSILLPDMWVKLEMARINRLASDRTGMSDDDAYAATLELQEQLNELVADLPPEFEAEIEKERDSLDHAAFHRLITLTIVANELINLHKRFYIRGWHDPKFESSRHICFSSARRICSLFRKVFAHIIPIDILVNSDKKEIDQMMETRQRHVARCWFFVHSSVGACLLLQHHCTLMDKYPDVAGPNATKVRAEILDDLRVIRLALTALSVRSEMAKFGVAVLSNPGLVHKVGQSAQLDPITPNEEEGPDGFRDPLDEETRKRRADLAHDLRSITDVDTFATKRVKMQGDDAHVYFRNRKGGRSSDSHEGSAAYGTPSSADRAPNGGLASQRPAIGDITQRLQGDDAFKAEQSRNDGGFGNGGFPYVDQSSTAGGAAFSGNQQGPTMQYTDMQSLLDTALTTDVGNGQVMAPELAFEKQVDWIGGGMLPTNFFGGGPTSPFFSSAYFGQWDNGNAATTQASNQQAASMSGLGPGATMPVNLLQQPGDATGGNDSMRDSSAARPMPAGMASQVPGNRAMESGQPPQHVQSWF